MPTKIEWATNPDGTKGESWNPVTGCSPISEGCAHCWAERMARRLAGRYGYPDYPDHFNVTYHPERLLQPLHWRKSRRIFVCSMGDLFHEEVEWADILDVWNVMQQATWHTFLVLTKRPRAMFDYVMDFWLKNGKSTLPNVWLGVTAENQRTADERIPILLQTPAAVRFVSCEPLLEPAGIRDYMHGLGRFYSSSAINWVIVGGESGPGARPMHPDWVRSLRDQCQEASVPFLFKQWGEWSAKAEDVILTPPGKDRFAKLSYPDYKEIWMARVGKKAAGRLLDGREWNEYPSEATS